MGILKVKGKSELNGSVKVAGAKNATTKMLVASLLSDKKSILHGVPNIGDVEITLNLLKEIGSEIVWDREAHTIEICTPEVASSYIPQRYSGANRIPILLVGALLGRTQDDIIVPTVGGDQIGKRTVDFHIEALRKLGATMEYREMKKEGAYFAHAYAGLQGNLIELPYPSVGATENSILASVRASGVTLIRNAAIEPEIIDLICFLQKMGAHISFDEERTIRVEGRESFHEARHTIISDRIEAASYGMLAIASRGRIFIEGAFQPHMLAFLSKINAVGGGYEVRENGIEFFYNGSLKGGTLIQTDVHPGFMTDWQQPFTVLLTQCEGISILHETVYDNRFGYVRTLKEMGANIDCFKECLGNKCCRFKAQNYSHSIAVRGVTPLVGRDIAIPDLRAGFAYLMAALIAEGESTISGVGFLERGYENIVENIASLGGDVTRVPLKEKVPLKQLVKDSLKVHDDSGVA